MSRKIFLADLNGSLPHNTISIVPVVPEVRVIQIKTIDRDSEELIVLDSPQTIESPMSVRYNTVTSSKVWIEIEGPYVDELSMGDLINVEVGLAKYGKVGVFRSIDGNMNFHKYLTVAYDIDNAKDAYIQGTLGVRTLDKYDNIVYTESIPISFNDDQEMVAHSTSGSEIVLPVKPSESTVKVLIGGNYTDEFSIEDNRIKVDIPDNTDCYVIYKPFYVENGMFSLVTDNISVNSNGEIELRDENCSSMVYNFVLEIHNTDLTSTNHTPVIKSLALISSNQ